MKYANLEHLSAENEKYIYTTYAVPAAVSYNWFC
jgi:hypothetical protein